MTLARDRRCGPRFGRLSVALALGLLPATVQAAVLESQLEVEGRIRDIAALDLDGDALEDLVAFSVSGHGTEAKRRASVFWQQPSRKFSKRPDIVWNLDASTAVVDPFPSVAEATQGSPVYSLRFDGVYRHRFHRDRGTVTAAKVLEISLPHWIAPDESLPLLDFAAAWSGSRDEFLIPGFPYPRLYRSVDGSRADSLILPVAPQAFYEMQRSGRQLPSTSLTAAYEFAMPASADQRGDGQKQIVLFERNRVSVFDTVSAAGAGKSGAETRPLQRIYPVRILTGEEAASDLYRVRHQLVDLDGDARADLVAVVFRDTGILEFTGRIMIFRAKADGSLARDADQVLQLDDALYNMTQILDLDGDGSMELVVPSARIGLWGYLRLLTTRKAPFNFNTYRLSAAKSFDTDHVVRDSMTLKLSRQYGLPVVALADIDGDGTSDLVIGRGEDQVCIHRGETEHRGRRFAPKPELCFEADPYFRFIHRDLNADRKEELIRYGTTGESRSRITITIFED